MPERDDPHNRREFWEQYLPCVTRSRVLISDEDANRNKSVLQDMKRKGKTAPGLIRQSSVFIMEMNSCYVLEFSETGNAAYVYGRKDKKHFPELYETLERLLHFKTVDKLSAQHLKLGRAIAQLSNSNKCATEHSVSCCHRPNPGWQQNLKRWLNLRGIRP